MSESMPNLHSKPDVPPPSKRARLDAPDIVSEPAAQNSTGDVMIYSEPDQGETSGHELEDGDPQSKPLIENLLPPSRVLLAYPSADASADGVVHRTVEHDVGISEYIAPYLSPIHGIIKQRFTDFLVYEVNLDNEVVHIKSLEMSRSEHKKKDKMVLGVGDLETTETQAIHLIEVQSDSVEQSNVIVSDTIEPSNLPSKEETGQPLGASGDDASKPWSESFEEALKPFLSTTAIDQLKQMYSEGPEPPFISDSGWEGRVHTTASADALLDTSDTKTQGERQSSGKGKARRGRGRGNKSGGGRGGHTRGKVEDHRKVISNPISLKVSRAELHKTIRELFGGKLDSETDTSNPSTEGGSRIAIKWVRQGSGRGGRGGTASGRGGREDRAPRGTYPPYIHFTLQKTNRDTQDALAYLSRILHVSIKDLSVAGTKDKRGVTTQRVSLKRNQKTVEDVWKHVNGQIGKKSLQEALTQRGERGIRVADLNYRKASLELGMLKGNAFVITLRNVQVESLDILDKAMNSIKHRGFINYYGMQRFGTASIPTHAIGLALLQSDWNKAVSMILRHRPGEHPDVVAARDAWLVEGDLEKALALMPRRVVAERCILESYKKQGGETRNAMGAFSTIPRNLRLMYVHAYQSYVWNAIVSERIKSYGAERPVVGDLVFETPPEEKASQLSNEDHDVENDVGQSALGDKSDVIEPDERDEAASDPRKRSRKPWEPPRVKTLTADDLNDYTIFDVIMALPGKDVAYPGGPLGERYREFLRRDGLDPDNLVRKQKDYSLSGSYRKILHLPRELSWTLLRYTDPDVPLAQADEDKLLGFEPPVIDEDGKFLALQIKMTLGTASYATMALREVTKTDTSSHYQTGLTQLAADQPFRGTSDNASRTSKDEKSNVEE